MSKYKNYIVGEKGGKGGGTSRPPVEAPDTLFSQQTLKLLEVVGEGEIASVSNVYFDDNPVTNLADVEYVVRTGTSTQNHIAGFSDVTSEFADGLEVVYGTPREQAVSSAGIDAVIITYGVNALYEVNNENGDTNGYSVGIAIDRRASSGGTWVQVFTDTITGKTKTEYKRAYRLDAPSDPPPAAWEWRIRRTTPNQTLARYADDTFLFSHTEIQEVKLSYDDTAYVGIFADAKATGGRVPRRSYEYYGLKVKVPNNYNPVTRVYTGVWSGTFDASKQYTNNPIWILYDLLTNTRYGMGIAESSIDKFSFYDAAVYCDEDVDDGNGGTEPRFTFNTPISRREDAWKLLQSIAGTANASLISFGGMVTIFQDRPTDMTDIITNNDVKDGLFDYSGTALGVRYNAINVKFNDANNRFLEDIVTVTDQDNIDEYGYNETDIVAYGCTSVGQAIRIGKWMLETELNSPEVVTFTVGLNRLNMLPYSVVGIQDEHYANATLSGKVISSDTSSMVADKDITLTNDSYTLEYYGQDGSTLRSVAINETNETTNTFSGTFTDPPLVGSSFALNGPVEVRPFRIIAISDNGDNTYNIHGVYYDENKWTNVEGSITIPTPTYSVINLATQEPVENLAAEEEQYVSNDIFRQRINVSWDAPVDGKATEYSLTWRRNDTEVNSIRNIQTTNWTLDNVTPGDYDITVRAYNTAGTASAVETVSLSVSSDDASGLYPPINLVVDNGPTTTSFEALDCGISWDNDSRNDDLTDARLKDWVIEVYDYTGTTLKNTYTIPQTDTKFVYYYEMNRNDFAGTASRTFQFKVYARDVANRRSTATSLAVENEAPSAVSLSLTAGFENVWIEITDGEEADITGYKVWGSTTNGFTANDATNLLYDGADKLVILTTTPGETKYYRAAAYDKFGKAVADLNLSSQYSSTGKGITDYTPKEYVYEGFEFSPSGNTLSWSAGTGYRVDGGNETSWSIGSGSVLYTGSKLYIYNTPQSTSLLSTTSLSTAVAGGGIILVTYNGGNDVKGVGNGDVFIDGGMLIAQTVGSSALVTDTAVITTQAQMGSATIGEAAIDTAAVTEAKIADASIGNAKIKDYIQSNDWNDTTKQGWKIDKSGYIQANSISIYDSDGYVILSSGTKGQDILNTANNFAIHEAWEFQSSADSWVGVRYTVTTQTDSIRLTATGTDPQLQKTGLSIDGSIYDKVRARIRRISGSGAWEGRLYYINGVHGHSGSYYKYAENNNDLSQWHIVEWDMANLTAGGDDWITNTTTGLRFDFHNTSGDVWEVDWIAVGKYSPYGLAAEIYSQGALATKSSVDLATGEVTNKSLANLDATAASSLAVKTQTFRQATQPTANTTGDIWHDTSDDSVYVWTGSVWDLAADKTSNKTAASITGQGNFATLNQITSANVSTYIASAAIGNAYISALDAGKITTGYLSAARINAGTLNADKIVANTITTDRMLQGAVTVREQAVTATSTSLTGTYATVQSDSIASGGGDVLIEWQVTCEVSVSNPVQWSGFAVKLLRASTTLIDYGTVQTVSGSTSTTQYVQISGSYLDTGATGTHTYHLQMSDGGYTGPSSVKNRILTLIATKT